MSCSHSFSSGMGNSEEQLPPPTEGLLLVMCQVTVSQQIYLGIAEKITSFRTAVGHQSTDCQLTAGNLSVRCWQPIGRMSVTLGRLLP